MMFGLGFVCGMVFTIAGVIVLIVAINASGEWGPRF